MSELIVVEPDEKLGKHLGASMQAHSALRWEHSADVAAAATADESEVRVILIGPGVPQDDALRFAESIAAQRPDIGTVLVRREVDTELLRSALRIGLADVVACPNGQLAELEAAVQTALKRAIRLRGEEADETFAAICARSVVASAP